MPNFPIVPPDPPSGYTPNYNFPLWAQDSNPGAFALNALWTTLDSILASISPGSVVCMRGIVNTYADLPDAGTFPYGTIYLVLNNYLTYLSGYYKTSVLGVWEFVADYPYVNSIKALITANNPSSSNAVILRNDIGFTATTNPGVNNDGVDTAGLGRVFNVGDDWLNTDTKHCYKCFSNETGAAVWENISESQPGYSENETEQTTSSTTYQIAQEFSFLPRFTGQYIFKWSAEIASADPAKSILIRVDRGDTIILNECSIYHEQSNSYEVISGFKRINMTGGTPAIFRVKYAISSTGTAKIRRIRIFVKRI